MREDGRAKLRERLHSVAEHWWLSPSIPDDDNLGILANAILAEIEAAGVVLVEAERWDRVRRAADCGCDVSDDCCGKLRGDDLDSDAWPQPKQHVWQSYDGTIHIDDLEPLP